MRWRLDALDKWRLESDGRMAVMESHVTDIRFTDAVAEALARKLHERGPVVPLPLVWKLLIGFATLVTIADSVKGLVW